MAKRTQIFSQLPWIGGVNNSLDPSMIPPNQLVQADHVTFDTRGSRQKRDGINFNWDGATVSSTAILGGLDFWYGTSTKTQNLVAIDAAANYYSYTPAVPPTTGTRAKLTLDATATAWSNLPTRVDLLAMNNMVIMAGNGSNNVPKTWTGGSNHVFDLTNYAPYASLPASSTRASSSTTRTLVFQSSVSGIITNGDHIQVINSGNSNYNGQFTVTSVVSATITYTAPLSFSEGTTVDTGILVNKATSIVPPNFSMMSSHLGRLWVNDPSNPDRLQYSPVGDPTTWQGNGDSGAIDIGLGDGDPTGITAIFPSFKGVLFVAKRTKLYRIDGFNPEDFQVTLVSDGIGCVGHGAVCLIDEQDVYFVSDRGIHSLAATANYGDFDSTFISEDIQRGFRDNWPASIRPLIHAIYVPSLNSALFATADTTISSNQETIWCYNIVLKAWYRWPSISCTALFPASDTDKKRFYIGTSTQKLGQALTGNKYDIDTSGNQVAILYTIVTGLIFPDNQPYLTKGFKKFSLVYRPQGSHNISVTITIDNQQSQSLSFASSQSAALLGSSFFLGTSVLGASFVMSPYTFPIDGYGRGFQLQIQESGVNEFAEIQGFMMEYQVAGTQQEVRLGSTS